MDADTCREARIVLGAVGLTPVRAAEAENELRGKPLGDDAMAKAAEAARATSDPQPDMRGSAEYKRALVAALVKRAIAAAGQRARGQAVEVSHIYA
jgi:carbon-monoxide dehydrogenase medium subunit